MQFILDSPMRFLVLSSIVVLTTMSLFFHEVQGMRHRRWASSISLEHQTAIHDEKVILGPHTSAGGVNHDDATVEKEEMMVVVTRRRRSTSIRVANSSKKKQPQQQRHHWIPSIQEDYFGPRHHKPAHH